jgi:hypothetical protein
MFLAGQLKEREREREGRLSEVVEREAKGE